MDNRKKPKILYIEDDRTLAAIYGARLVNEGFEVKQCYDGDSALQVAREFRPDLIIVDLMMPTLSGYDAIDIFRNTLETSTARIVVMSALSQPEDIDKAMAMGADDYLVKSQVVIDDVVSRIRHHLDEAAGRIAEPAETPAGTAAADPA